MARSGVEAARLALTKGANIFLADAKKEAELDDIDDIKTAATACYFGMEADLDSIDLIVVSPGVPPNNALLESAREQAIDILVEIEFAARFAKGIFVGITGTNGKTTTTTLTALMLKAAGKRAYACGNIGIALSKIVREQNHEENIYVTELSSYQLEYCQSCSFDIAVMLNLTPDHLARHKSLDNYFQVKLKLFAQMKDKENIIYNYNQALFSDIRKLYPRAFSFGWDDNSDIYCEEGAIKRKLTGKTLIYTSDLKIKGEHNIENVMAALAIVLRLKADLNAALSALKQFNGVEHRNQNIGSYKDIIFINDSKATNPEATVPALKALDRETVLIAGGMDKGSDYSLLLNYFQHIKHTVLFGESKADIAAVLAAANKPYTITNDLDSAVRVALGQVVAGDAILLSPASASWDMYPSFERRGEHFAQILDELNQGTL